MEGDWAENFAILHSVFHLSKTDIKRSTLPYLKGLLNSIPTLAKLNSRLNGGGCPLLGIGGESEEVPKERYREADEAPTMSEIENFFGG